MRGSIQAERTTMANRNLSPDSIIVRGPFVARHYHISTGPGSMRVWCELEVDGARYQPFTQDFECSLGPVSLPAAATLSVEDGSERGLHLLRMPDGRPVLTKLSNNPTFNGFWTGEGREYIHEGWAVSVLSGEKRKLPPYPGQFLCFSPDGQSLVSFTYEPPSPEIILHQVDLASGTDESTMVKREDLPWLTDSSHLLPGTLESAHIWQAQHLGWQKPEGGRYKFSFDKKH